MNKLMFFLALLWAAPILHAEQVITGTVESINPEARAITINQVNAPTGEPRTVYLASVIDSDLVNEGSLEDLQVGETVSVRVSDLHNISYAPAAETTPVVTQKIVKEKKESENLFEDVGEIRHSSLSID
jgi:hypothetical protein